MRAAQTDRGRADDFDLQSKCAKDSKQWFIENYLPKDKETILVDFSDHYDKKNNKCFILVERHYESNLAGPNGTSWTNHISLYDVYENSEYGEFAENHYTYWKPKLNTSEEVISCKVHGSDCKTSDQFDNLVRPFMND